MKAALAASLVILLAGCGSEASGGGGADEPAPAVAAELSPTATVQRFYDALLGGEYGDARTLLLPMADAARQEKLAESLGATGAMMETGELALSAHEHVVAGDWALVVTRHARRVGEAEDVLIRDEFVYRTADGWRIATEPMRSDALIEPLWNGDATQLLNAYRAGHADFVMKYR
ncbi:MAG: hypothetical protein AAF682_12925 [Planctomycetota bacterium]